MQLPFPGVELEKVLSTGGCHKNQTPNEGEYSCRLMLEKLLSAIVVAAILVAVACTFPFWVVVLVVLALL
jgi:hypothetical protein